VHQTLRQKGFRGCTSYDCFGAGQQVSQVTFAGTNWRQSPETAAQMFDAFAVMRQLHESLWYLTEALSLPTTPALRDEIQHAVDATEQLTQLDAGDLVALDLASHQEATGSLLRRFSELVRARAPRRDAKDHRNDLQSRLPGLIGADLRGADLRGMSLRGVLLIAADLRRADLRFADLIGADLRDADLRGADLSSALFLTQSQLNPANGNAKTRLPPAMTRPTHWQESGG
jgi:uncharacterized protein YjbI with pentapeptide repeats